MFRFVIRLLGFLLLAGAFVTFVIDGTRSVASSHLQWVRIGEALDRLVPKSPALIEAKLAAWHPTLWDPVGATVLALPLVVLLLVLGVLLVHFTEDRKPSVGTLARR